MKYTKHLTILLLVVLTSCSNFLEEYSQDTDYVNSWRDLNETLIGDCYMPVEISDMITQTSDKNYFIHFMGDELQECVQGPDAYTLAYDEKEKVFGYFTWQQRSGQNDTYTGFNPENESWQELYRLINVANNILFSAKDLPKKSEDDQIGTLKVEGEAHFLRAFYYFWLVNLYGEPYSAATATTALGVPLKLSEKVEDKIFRRNTIQEVYDQILDDLNQAETDLSQTGEPYSIYRAGLTSTQFLLSRVYLYMQNWEKAAEYADKVIKAHPALTPLNILKGSFLSKTSIETIFSMGGNSLPCIISYKYKGFKVSKDLYDSYSNNDIRKSKFWWTYEDFVGYTKVAPLANSAVEPNSSTYYTEVYNGGWRNNAAEVSDKFLFRSAEAYLIKAEAEAYLGKDQQARAALNTLRQNRYTQGTNYEVTSSGQELVTEIRNERRKELALEGARWFDIRRYSVCDVYPESKPITHDYYYYESRSNTVKTEVHTFTLEANDKAYTLPIPNEVLTFNTGMKNNERPNRTYTVKKIN
ncbi:RagB/SusD family nutrient uptake outer membrane protein [uncultured Bacteroides sp.]|uniref:RagB/SusD family nutrient uptake outer membrane protein n=1 Tax=uncultured Bacteroides sp. TaxID=162156 RepID=UPI002AAA7CBB|nr:RagB/SusD family nutrient uptake outer membrane protein [uncultured Bacteroides sp.]